MGQTLEDYYRGNPSFVGELEVALTKSISPIGLGGKYTCPVGELECVDGFATCTEDNTVWEKYKLITHDGSELTVEATYTLEGELCLLEVKYE